MLLQQMQSKWHVGAKSSGRDSKWPGHPQCMPRCPRCNPIFGFKWVGYPGGSYLGCSSYARRDACVGPRRVLSYGKENLYSWLFRVQKRDGLFNMPIDESIYRAAVAHEVAHAIAFHNFKDQATLVGQEHIGFVTLFWTLDRTNRDKIRSRYSYDEGWQSHARMLYLMPPWNLARTSTGII